MSKEYKYMVCVRCCTYNQESFIGDTLRGFTIQETKFPVVYCIVDDASKDSEPVFLKKWAEENLLFDEEELNSGIEMSYGFICFGKYIGKSNLYFVILLLNKNLFQQPELKLSYTSKWELQSKYIAYCEGDDYWIDSQKLQKQYEILETEKDASFVYTKFQTVDVNSKPITVDYCENYINKSHSGYVFLELLATSNYILTVTTFYRRECLEKVYPDYYDYGFFLQSARQGKAVYLPDVTSCYRINPNSITNVPSTHRALFPKQMFIRYNEIKEALRGNICQELKIHPMLKPTIGFAIGYLLNRRYSPYRWKLLFLLFRYPAYIIPTIKGFFMELLNSKSKKKLLQTLKET